MRTGEVGQSALTCLCSGQFQKYVYILSSRVFLRALGICGGIDPRSATHFGYFICGGL